VALREWWKDDNPGSEEQPEEKQAFATGHWGCGAFGGDKQLKVQLPRFS